MDIDGGSNVIQVMLVEDDPVLGRALSVSLETAGYQIFWARDYTTAAKTNQEQRLHLVLLDLGLPDGNGLNLLKEIRKSGSRIPVIILTAQTDEGSVVDGLQSGANDYVRKPFGKLELIARIKTALKEPQEREDQIRCGELLVLLSQRKVMHGDQEVTMKRREFDLLAYFARRFGSVVTREELIEGLTADSDIFDRTIDSHVSHLRARLRKAGVSSLKISSVYGLGYRMDKK